MPHPNEPIGAMMLEYFTRELAENKELREKLDYTWYIVKSWMQTVQDLMKIGLRDPLLYITMQEFL